MADIQKEDIKKIVSEQARKMKAFLRENLPPSAQNGPVEVRITPENSVISPEQYPPELEKRVVAFKDIATLKEVAGIPDELHRMGAAKWQDRFGGADLNEADFQSLKKLSNSNALLACDLMHSYIYGDSSKVARYEKLLNRLYFPMEVCYFGNEYTDLVVPAGTTCTFKETEGPISLQFNSIKLGEKARIVDIGNINVLANELQQEGDTADDGNWCSFGADGAPGNDGGHGGTGGDGKDGGSGSSGGAGANGGDGGDGNNAATVSIRIQTISGQMVTCSVGGAGGAGGNGGDGGDGGNGGDGGDGGNGGDGIDKKGSKEGGNGGDGGAGGNGGNGGNAGNGGGVNIYTDSQESVIFNHRQASGGAGGAGGHGGNAGHGGSGYKGSSGGKPGNAGAAGTPGKTGASGEGGDINIFPFSSEG